MKTQLTTYLQVQYVNSKPKRKEEQQTVSYVIVKEMSVRERETGEKDRRETGKRDKREKHAEKY